MRRVYQELAKLAFSLRHPHRGRRFNIPDSWFARDLSQAIASHRLALERCVRFQRLSQSGFWPIWLAPRAIAQKRKKAALDQLINLMPDDQDEACRKTIYIMAVMLSGEGPLDEAQVRRAKASLRQFRDDVHALLVTDA